MSFSLLPEYIFPSVTDLSPEYLKSRGIRLLMLDFDNTIVPYTTDVPTEQMEAWIRTMCASDIRLCVVSNSHRDRVKIFCKKYEIPCITHAGKPGTKGIQQCLRRFSVPASEAALVGDQIYTDTLGSNLAGVHPVLIRAINNHNFWLKARHLAELPFIGIAEYRIRHKKK